MDGFGTPQVPWEIHGRIHQRVATVYRNEIQNLIHYPEVYPLSVDLRRPFELMYIWLVAGDCPSQLTLGLRPLLLGRYSCIYPSLDSRRLYILPLHVRERTAYNPYPCLIFNFLSTPSISLWNYVLFNKGYYPKLVVRPVHICRSHFESVQFDLQHNPCTCSRI